MKIAVEDCWQLLECLFPVPERVSVLHVQTWIAHWHWQWIPFGRDAAWCSSPYRGGGLKGIHPVDVVDIFSHDCNIFFILKGCNNGVWAVPAFPHSHYPAVCETSVACPPPRAPSLHSNPPTAWNLRIDAAIRGKLASVEVWGCVWDAFVGTKLVPGHDGVPKAAAPGLDCCYTTK